MSGQAKRRAAPAVAAHLELPARRRIVDHGWCHRRRRDRVGHAQLPQARVAAQPALRRARRPPDHHASTRRPTVTITNGRPHLADFGLDRSGFTLLRTPQRGQRLRRPGQLDGTYAGRGGRPGEGRRLGADEVVSLGWVIRRANRRSTARSRPPPTCTSTCTRAAPTTGMTAASPRARAVPARDHDLACGARSARRRRTGRWPCSTTAPSMTPRASRTCCCSWTSCPTPTTSRTSRIRTPCRPARSSRHRAAAPLVVLPRPDRGRGAAVQAARQRPQRAPGGCPHTAFEAPYAATANPRESVEHPHDRVLLLAFHGNWIPDSELAAAKGTGL